MAESYMVTPMRLLLGEPRAGGSLATDRDLSLAHIIKRPGINILHGDGENYQLRSKLPGFQKYRKTTSFLDYEYPFIIFIVLCIHARNL